MSSTRTILVVVGEALAAPEACYRLVNGGFRYYLRLWNALFWAST